MDSLSAFMNDIFMPKPDNRIPVKEIYDAFQAWVVAKYGYKTWNEIGQRQIYAALKSSQDYQYVRFREGYCLKGIAYRPKPKVSEQPLMESEPEETETNSIEPSVIYLNVFPKTKSVDNQIIPPIKYIIPKPPPIVLPTFGRKE